MFKPLLTTTLFLTFLVLNPVAALACRCKTPASTSAAYIKADVVVYGHVDDLSGDINTQSGSVAVIKVSQTWKNDAPRHLKITNQTTCAYDFVAGINYLVFLKKSDVSGELVTTICSGNLAGSNAGAAKKWLDLNGMKAHTRISN